MDAHPHLFHLLIWSPPLNISKPRENLVQELNSAAQVGISDPSRSLNPFFPFPSAPLLSFASAKGKWELTASCLCKLHSWAPHARGVGPEQAASRELLEIAFGLKEIALP